MFLLWLRQLPQCGDQTPASVPPPAKGRSSPTNTPALPPSPFILPSFTWVYIFFSAGQVLLSALSLCSAFTSVSEGVFLMYPWKEIYSMSTYSSATLFSVLFFMVSFAVQNLYVWLAPICLFSFLFFTALEEEIDLRKCWHSLCQKIFFLCSLLGILWCHFLCLRL